MGTTPITFNSLKISDDGPWGRSDCSSGDRHRSSPRSFGSCCRHHAARSGRATILVEANRIFFSAGRQVCVPSFISSHHTATSPKSAPIRFGERVPTIPMPQERTLSATTSKVASAPDHAWLMDPRDYIVNAKKRYDCFVATDLDFVLRRRGISTLLITGSIHRAAS